MPRGNFFDLLVNTITEIQQNNQNSTKERTADPSIFDLLKDKVAEVNQQQKQRQEEPPQADKPPVSIIDLVKSHIEQVKENNRQDPEVETAPENVFDRLVKKVDERAKRSGNYSVRRIIDEYQINISSLSPDIMRQIQERYVRDHKSLDEQYAQYIHEVVQKYGQ